MRRTLLVVIGLVVALAAMPPDLLAAGTAAVQEAAEPGAGFTDLWVAVLGLVTSGIVKAVRTGFAKLNVLPPWIRTVLTVAIGTAVSYAGGLLGIALPVDPGTWDATVINAILTSLAAMGLHAGAKAIKKGNTPTPA